MSSFDSSPGTDNAGGYLVLGEVSAHCNPVVVAIDFGTAYSGIAFAYKADPWTIQFGAPTAEDGVQKKVPTALLSKEDGTWEFGNAAEAKYNEILMSAELDEGPVSAHLFKRFKIVLLREESGFDTLMALSISGKEVPLMDLVVKSLVHLKNFAMEKVILGYGAGLDAVKDVQWVLTVPAIWNDFGKAFMRKAAFAAGLIDDEHSDHLMQVLEPEGAALAVHAAATQHGLLGVDSRFMVLDCGGGTVDITVHEVKSAQPLALQAVSVPTGGDWGGDYVNLEFKKFLRELLGADLYKEQELPYEFYSIGVEFDRVKVNFDPSCDPAVVRLIDVLDDKKQLTSLAEAYNAAHPDKPVLITPALRKGFLTMSKALMLSFFEPFLLAIVNETRTVLLAHTIISNIVVVGGFGSSKVVIERIKAEFHDKAGIRILLPAKPQEAIVHGAVYCGLYKHLIVESCEAPGQSGSADNNSVADDDASQKSSLLQVAHCVTRALALMVDLSMAEDSCRGIEVSLQLHRLVKAQNSNYVKLKTIQEYEYGWTRCPYCVNYGPFSSCSSCNSKGSVRNSYAHLVNKEVTDVIQHMKTLYDKACVDIAAAESQIATAQTTKAGLLADLDRVADTVYQTCSEIAQWPETANVPSAPDKSFAQKRDAFLRQLLVAVMTPRSDLDKLKATDLLLLRSLDEIAAVAKGMLVG